MASSSSKRPAEASLKAPAPLQKHHQANPTPPTPGPASQQHIACEQIMWLKDPALAREADFSNPAATKLLTKVKVYHLFKPLLILELRGLLCGSAGILVELLCLATG